MPRNRGKVTDVSARTPTFRLIDHILEGRLEEFVTTRRDAGRSWRLIARDVREATGVDVTFETVRGWFITENGAAA